MNYAIFLYMLKYQYLMNRGLIYQSLKKFEYLKCNKFV